MARRSAAKHANPSSSAITPMKRALSPAQETPRRQSQRTKSGHTTPATHTTPKKSQYFEPESHGSDSDTADDDDHSGYEGEETSAVSSTPASEGDEDAYNEEDARPRKRRGRPKGGRASAGQNAQELWRPGVKTGLGPGKQVLIKIPKARAPGKTPYEDNTIHPNTMLFLRDLAQNNDREWLKSKFNLLRGLRDVVLNTLSAFVLTFDVF